jgi:hypothetical protein
MTALVFVSFSLGQFEVTPYCLIIVSSYMEGGMSSLNIGSLSI